MSSNKHTYERSFCYFLSLLSWHTHESLLIGSFLYSFIRPLICILLLNSSSEILNFYFKLQQSWILKKHSMIFWHQKNSFDSLQLLRDVKFCETGKNLLLFFDIIGLVEKVEGAYGFTSMLYFRNSESRTRQGSQVRNHFCLVTII